MTEQARTTKGIRVTRPYASEDAYLEGDLPCYGRGWMVLPGVAPRPPGEVVRFEIALGDGRAVFRGEGRVVAHRSAPDGKPAGLEVRVLRVDARSRAVLERAAELRARSATLTGLDDAPPSVTPEALLESGLPPAGGFDSRVAPAPRNESPQDRSIASLRARVGSASIAPPPARDALLARLRLRAPRAPATG